MKNTVILFLPWFIFLFFFYTNS